MGSDQAVLTIQKRFAHVERGLLVEDVDAGGSNGAAAEGVSEILRDDYGTAGHVDQDG